MKSGLSQPLLLGAAFTFLAFTLLSCKGCESEKIPLPTSDATPPTYKWVVFVQNDAGDQIEFTTSSRLALGRDYRYNVYFIAYDNDGGIKSISMTGSGLTACPQRPSANIASVSCSDQATLWPDPDGKVEKSAFRYCIFDVTCRSLGGTLFPQVITGPGGTVTLKGFAENYYGGKVNSTLTIVNTPG